jgi:hypothetical protein
MHLLSKIPFRGVFVMKEEKNLAVKVFLKSMLYTATVISLLVIGYFSAEFLFGG